MMKKSVLVILTFALVSCSGTKAFYDYNKDTDFKAYKTFNFYTDMRTGLGKLDENRLKGAIREALQSEEYTTTEENPDFKINMYVETFEKQNSNSIGVGVGGGDGYMGGNISGGIPIGGTKTYLSITIEFAKASDDDLFWQAVVESPFNPSDTPAQRIAYFQKIAEKALEEYPPEQKK